MTKRAVGRSCLSVSNTISRAIPVATGSKTQALVEWTPIHLNS